MVVILVGEGEEQQQQPMLKSPHLSDAQGVVGGCGGVSSKKKHENPLDNSVKHGGSASVGNNHQLGAEPVQNGLDPRSAPSESTTAPVAELRNGEIGDSPNTQTAIGDQSSGGSGKRNFSRPSKHTIPPTPPTGQITNGLGAQAPPKYGLNHYPKSTFANAKNKSTTTSIADQYALSSETYDLDFPPSLASSIPPTSTPWDKITGKGVEKCGDEGMSERVNSLVGQISPEFALSSTKAHPRPPGANCTINPTLPASSPTSTTPSSPPAPDEGALTSNQLGGPDERDTTCPNTKITGNGPRKKGNKAKWVPIQITRAPFRDEFFSSSQGSSSGGPAKAGFGPSKREGNNGGPAASVNSLGSGRRVTQATSGPTAPFRRQNSQYNSSQPRDSPTPSNKQQSPTSHDQTSCGLDDQPNNDIATTITSAKGATNTNTSMSEETVTSQSSPPSSVGSLTTDPNKSKSGQGEAEVTPTNATPSNFPLSPPSFRSTTTGKPVQNGPVKVGTGSSSTIPRRPSSHYGPNHRSSGGSSRVSQTLADAPGTTGPPAPYNNQHISHNLPLFAGHPGLTRLHLNGGHPLPSYISPTAHHQHPMAAGSGVAGGAFQIPLMAPYPYDNEAYYNYNTVLTHPFFATHHPPHLYYRSIATSPGLPIHPQHSVGIVNNSNVATAGLLPLAPMPGPNQSQQHRWGNDAANNNSNNPNDLGVSSGSKMSSSQHIRSNSVAALGYSPPGPLVLTDENKSVAAAPVISNGNSTTVDESLSVAVDDGPNATRTTTSALSSTPLAPKLQQQAVTNVRSKSETSSATPATAKDLAPPPQVIIPAALPSLMSALPPHHTQQVAPLLAPTGAPSAHYFVQNSLSSPLPGPLLGPSLAPVVPAPGPAILVGGGGPEPSPILVLAGGGGAGHTVSPQFNVPLVDQLRKQIEYYFSEENLHKDLFLRRNMDAQGFIPLSLIATFHRVKMLTSDIYLIRQAIKLSTEVDFVNDRVRTKHNPTIWPITLAPPQQPHHSSPAHPMGPPYAQTPPPSPQPTPSESSIIQEEQTHRKEGVSQFAFPTSIFTHQNLSIDSLPQALPLSDDDVKLLDALLHRGRGAVNPRQLADSLSPRYFCRYLTRKSYSLPDLSSPERPDRIQLDKSPAYGSRTLAQCMVVTPTEQLTRALRPDLSNPHFHLWKESERTSLLKAAERLAQILTATFVHLNTPHRADRLSTCTSTSTRGQRSACRRRCNSYPSPRTLHDDPSSFLPKFSLCTEPSTLAWCYEQRPSPPHLLAHDSSSNPRKTNPAITSGRFSQQQAGPKTSSDDLLALLKHEGWITVVPYNTLLQNLQSNDAPGREATLKSLYDFWSHQLIAERNSVDQNLLDLFRETVFKHPDPYPTFRFGVDRLLETCSKCIEIPGSRRDILLPKITNDLSRAIQNGGISVQEAKRWVEKSLLPPLNKSTRLRLNREMKFLCKDHL